MTPDEFDAIVVPRAVSQWSQNCFCLSSGFQKLLAFDFRNYGISPAAMVDSEILIDQIIRRHFVRVGEPKSEQGEITQCYRCPKCAATCVETYAEFSISMYQSTIVFDRRATSASVGLYLVGFRAFDAQAFARIHDYHHTTDIGQFLNQLI